MKMKNTAAAVVAGASLGLGLLGFTTATASAAPVDSGEVSAQANDVRKSLTAKVGTKAAPFSKGLGARGNGGRFNQLKGMFSNATNPVKQAQQQCGLIFAIDC